MHYAIPAHNTLQRALVYDAAKHHHREHLQTIPAHNTLQQALVYDGLRKLRSIRRSFPTFVFQTLVVTPTSVVGTPASAASWLHATEWTY